MAWAMWIRDRKFQWVAISAVRRAVTRVGLAGCGHGFVTSFKRWKAA